MELNAAEALLQLHFGTARPASDIKVEIEGAATLRLTRRPASAASNSSLVPANTSPRAKLHSILHDLSPGNDKYDNSETEVNSQSSIDSPIAYKTKKYARKTTTDRIREQATQTDDYLDVTRDMAPRAKDERDHLIAKLYARIRSLESQLKAYQRHPLSPPISEIDPDVSTDLLLVQKNKRLKPNYETKCNKRRSSAYNMNNTATMDSEDEWNSDDHKSNGHMLQATWKSKEMVAIGEGYASVPARLLKQIDWSSYTGATRKLLTAVFSRRVLATHSLTGKPSPAFPDKPAKKRLNTDLVNDIVQTVVERCRVPESVVRTNITTKCADESKMYRSRQQKRQQRKSFKSNQENVPPRRYEDSSDDTN